MKLKLLNRLRLTAFWDYRRHLKRAQQCKDTAVLCHVWPPAQADPAVRILRKMEYWFSDGGLGCLQSGVEVSSPGIASFEDFVRSREANKTHDGAQHVSTTLHSLVRRRLEQETNWATHGRIGPLKLEVWRIPGLALKLHSFGHRSRAKWCLFTCFRSPTDRGECWGWSYKTRLSVPVAF